MVTTVNFMHVYTAVNNSGLTIPYKQVKGNEKRETNAIAYFRDNRANSLHVDIFGHNWL